MRGPGKNSERGGGKSSGLRRKKNEGLKSGIGERVVKHKPTGVSTGGWGQGGPPVPIPVTKTKKKTCQRNASSAQSQ